MIRSLIIAAALLAAIFAQPVRAAGPPPWFSDDFDSYSIGNLSGQGVWKGSEKSFQVQDTLSKSGKALLCDYMKNTAGQISAEVKSPGSINLIEMDVYMDAARSMYGGEGKSLVDIDFHNSDGGPITRLSLADTQLKLALANQNTAVVCPLPNATWMHVTLYINLGAGSIDVCVDGTLRLRGGWPITPSTAIGKITISDWLYGYAFDESVAVIDNIVCSAVTPTAASALGRASSWERSLVAWPSVMYDAEAKIYRMYYSGTAGGNNGESSWSIWHIGMATSKDGAGFGRVTKRSDPVLWSTRLLEGDILNPADMAQRFDSVWAIAPCVIRDGKQFKMWYTGWTGEVEHNNDGTDSKINYRIGYATSDDGMTWTKKTGSAGAGSIFGLGPAGALDAKGVGEPCVLKEKNLYRMWYEGFDGKTWRIFYATSPDGVKWTRKGVALEPGSAGELDALGVRNPVVIQRKGQYELWYQGRGAQEPNHHVLRAVSPYGVKWKKVPGEVIFGPPDRLDTNERIYADSVIVQPDGSCRAYFTKEDISALWMVPGTGDRVFSNYTEVVNP